MGGNRSPHHWSRSPYSGQKGGKMHKKHFTRSEKVALFAVISEFDQHQYLTGQQPERGRIIAENWFDHIETESIRYVKHPDGIKLRIAIIFKRGRPPLIFKVELEKLKKENETWSVEKIIIVDPARRGKKLSEIREWGVLTKIFLPKETCSVRVIRANSFKEILSQI